MQNDGQTNQPVSTRKLTAKSQLLKFSKILHQRSQIHQGPCRPNEKVLDCERRLTPQASPFLRSGTGAGAGGRNGRNLAQIRRRKIICTCVRLDTWQWSPKGRSFLAGCQRLSNLTLVQAAYPCSKTRRQGPRHSCTYHVSPSRAESR